MRPSTRHTLERSARLARDNQLAEAVHIAEAVIVSADPFEVEEIREWLATHTADFVGEVGD